MSDVEGLRPLVAKHQELFEGYVRQHGADLVRELLDKGKFKKGYKLTVLRNKKDRYQMIQALSIHKVKT
jgi:hypothetical protein